MSADKGKEGLKEGGEKRSYNQRSQGTEVENNF